MKICFLTHNLRQDNGAGVFSLRLIRGVQEESGFEVVALTTIESGWEHEKPILYPSFFGLLQQIFSIRRIMKECDIIHVLDAYPYGIIAFLASAGLRKKRIVTAIGTGSIQPLYTFPSSLFLKIVYARANVVTAVSSFTKREVEKKIPRRAIRIIHHGVDYEMFQDRTLPQYGEQYKPYMLSVGTLRWRKGFHSSIRAFAKISSDFPSLKYLIAGKRHAPDYYKRLQALIRELNLEKRVFILDAVNDRKELIALYRGAELFCLLSQNKAHDVEAFGLVFLEAAAAGLPVIGSKDCGVEDALREGVNGFLVGERDIEALANAMKVILSDRALHDRMANASREFAKEHAWERQIAKYLELYDNRKHAIDRILE